MTGPSCPAPAARAARARCWTSTLGCTPWRPTAVPPTGQGSAEKNLVKIEPRSYAALFDRTRVYHKLLGRKRRRGWQNLVIEPETVGRLLDDAAQDWYELYAPLERITATEFGQLRALEDLAVELITVYAERFWRRERRRWEHDRIEVVSLDEGDPNHVEAWELSADATETRLVEDIRTLASCVQDAWFHRLKVGVILAKVHAYQPLLHAGKDRQVTVRPVPLDENEKKVVEGLAALAENGDPCLQGRELFLIRNPTRGRGVSFFDDFNYYPDFIVWLKDDDRQHVVFLDPKGLRRLGDRERRKVRLHHEIAEVEKRVRYADPNLHLRAYVLSVTAPTLIGDSGRSVEAWKQDGVYFLDDPNCLKQVVGHALETAPTAR